MDKLKISIITPCYNAENYIYETVESVINQNAVLSKRVELEYIIVDGNSSDQTLNKVNMLKNDTVKIISETDGGMYEALVKGLQLCTGDIVAYINAGDYYSKHAFDIILSVFEKEDINWVTGLNVLYNESSQFVSSMLPFKYRERFFKCGFYNGKVLPCVQQESTFWRANLSKYIDYSKLKEFIYAGDYYLWWTFSNHSELKVIEAYLGGFRVHSGQLSSNKIGYYNELDKIADRRPTLLDAFLVKWDYIMWKAPTKYKKKYNSKGLYRFNHKKQDWE
jgi:glycosyltransferase involved in cell wall biosynthesis